MWKASLALFLALSWGCGTTRSGASSTSAAGTGDAHAHNTLTEQQRNEGWRLLFDGRSSEGWRGFNRPSFPAQGWTIADGLLLRQPGGGRAGDLVTVEKFGNFDLRLEWRLAPAGNSGIKYLVDESLVKDDSTSGLGFEYQILDDERHPDAHKGATGTHRAGALYDLIPPSHAAARPPGEWNESRLIVDGARVEHWLNGVKVVEFERGSAALGALISQSKYKSIPGFGQAEAGHILLQDHGSDVAFRNIKVRELAKVSSATNSPRP